MFNRITRLLLIPVSLAILLVAGVQAQTAVSTIVGTVVDPTGAIVPNASVVARNVDTGIERTTKTTTEGFYRFDSLPPGVYDVHIEATGFAKADVKGIKLQVGERRDVNVNLIISDVTENIEVTAAAPLIETTKTDVS